MDEREIPERMTFFRSFWEAEKRMRSQRDRLSFLEGILSYALDGMLPEMTPAASSTFILVKPVLDSSRKKARSGKLGGSRGKANPKQSGSEKEEGETEEEKGKTEEETKERFRAYGEFGWVRLTDGQHERLLAELGAEELERCVRYVDEAAQKTGNKNRWKDWNLVVRSCHRDGWGLRITERRAGDGDRGHSGGAGKRPEEWNIHYD